MKPKKRKILAKEIPAEQIVPDDKNFNVGNSEGAELIEKSFKRFGAGRSILIDKNNRAIGGNKSLQGFKRTGGKNVIIVDADKDTLVAVRRMDVDLDTKEGREMALADNQTQAINYVPDEELIAVVAEELKIDTIEWGIPLEKDSQSETVSFSAKKSYLLKIQFPTKGMLKKAEKEINKLIREKYSEATITMKI